MNISPSAVSRNPDLQILFDSEQPKQRSFCPLCREEGHDTTGSNLSVGAGRIHCFRDEDHGRELWLELRPKPQRSNGIDSLPPVLPADDDDPHGAFFNEAYDDRGNARQQDDAETLRLEIEILFRANADDLDALDETRLDSLLKKGRWIVARSSRENFVASYACGKILKHKRLSISHGGWEGWCEQAGIDSSWAGRCMKLAGQPWEEIQHFKSAGACLAAEREARKMDLPPKREVEVEAETATIIALEEKIEEQATEIAEYKIENPTDDDLRARVEQLERELKATKSRNLAHVREARKKDKEIATLEREKTELERKLAVRDVELGFLEHQIRNNADLPAADQIRTDCSSNGTDSPNRQNRKVTDLPDDERMLPEAVTNRKASQAWKRIVKTKGRDSKAFDELVQAGLEMEQQGGQIPVMPRLAMLGLPLPDFDDCISGELSGAEVCRLTYEDWAAGTLFEGD